MVPPGLRPAASEFTLWLVVHGLRKTVGTSDSYSHTEEASMYRNVIFALIASVLVVNLAVAKELFNGKDLSGWEGDARVWTVQNGMIVGQTKDVPLKHNTFLIWKDGKVGDFKLTAEFKLEGGNSGIQYRSKVVDPKEYIVAGYQADMDGENQYTGILYEERGRGILAKRGERLTISPEGKKDDYHFGGAAELAKSIKKGEWNTYEIEAVGPKLKHSINGKLMSETIDNEKDRQAESGVLALQVHSGLPKPMKISFRKIHLEDLDSTKTTKGKEEKAKAE